MNYYVGMCREWRGGEIRGEKLREGTDRFIWGAGAERGNPGISRYVVRSTHGVFTLHNVDISSPFVTFVFVLFCHVLLHVHSLLLFLYLWMESLHTMLSHLTKILFSPKTRLSSWPFSRLSRQFSSLNMDCSTLPRAAGLSYREKADCVLIYNWTLWLGPTSWLSMKLVIPWAELFFRSG